MANRLKFQIQFTEEQPQEITQDAKKFEDFYICTKTLGQGAHAVVKQALKKGTQDMYAVKIMRSNNEEVRNTVRRTFNNTRCLRHPNIAQDIELYINEKMETYYLVMEYCPFQSLESVIKKRKLTQEELKVVFKQLLLAVQHAHQKGICHRDIKPDNILVNLTDDDGSSHVKLIDFGVSRRYIMKSQEVDMLTKTGNVFYCAPEIYHQSGYSKEIDIWAIGVILYQSVFQELPLHCDDSQDFVDLLKCPEKWQFKEKVKSLDLPLQSLILSMLNYDRRKRITVDDAIKHPFFEIGTIRDVMALIGSTNLDSDGCGRCRSLQSSLKINSQWGDVIKRLQHSQNKGGDDDAIIEDLVRDFGNVHILQKHDDKCGLIQLMNSISSSNAILSKLGSRQDLLDKSFQVFGSANKIEKHSHSDPFSDLCHIQSSLEMKDEQQQQQQQQKQINSKMFAQLGAHLDYSIDIQEQDGNIQKKVSMNNMFGEMGIKEVDEITEDQL